jgi:hypothetical protein
MPKIFQGREVFDDAREPGGGPGHHSQYLELGQVCRSLMSTSFMLYSAIRTRSKRKGALSVSMHHCNEDWHSKDLLFASCVKFNTTASSARLHGDGFIVLDTLELPKLTIKGVCLSHRCLLKHILIYRDESHARAAENHVFEVGIFFDRWRLSTVELFFRINKRVRY